MYIYHEFRLRSDLLALFDALNKLGNFPQNAKTPFLKNRTLYFYVLFISRQLDSSFTAADRETGPTAVLLLFPIQTTLYTHISFTHSLSVCAGGGDTQHTQRDTHPGIAIIPRAPIATTPLGIRRTVQVGARRT